MNRGPQARPPAGSIYFSLVALVLIVVETVTAASVGLVTGAWTWLLVCVVVGPGTLVVGLLLDVMADRGRGR